MRHGRGFRLRDGLLMIAVTAVGLTWARESWEAIRAHEGTFSDWSYRWSEPALRTGFRPPTLGETSLYDSARALLASALYVGTACAATWGIALVAMDRLRRPRSRLWRPAPGSGRVPGWDGHSDPDAPRARHPAVHSVQSDPHQLARAGSLCKRLSDKGVLSP